MVSLAATPASAAQRGGVRDSAGVAIASHRERNEPRVAFTLSPLPVMAIGGVSGDANYEFGQNVPAAARFADGRIVVADPNPPAVRIYSREGRYVRTLGRRGTGSGEYNNPTNVFILRGDTIAVVDNGRADAILLFTPDGKFQRLERTRTSGFVSMLASGEWLTRSGGGPSGDSIRIFRRPRGDSVLAAAPAEPPRRPGDTAAARGAGRRGVPTPETGALITTLPGRARISMPDSGGARAAQPGGGGRAMQPAGSPSPFVLAPIVAGLPDGFVYGDPARYEIREYAASGALRRIIRRRVDLRLDSAEIARYKAAQLAGREGEALREAERRIAAMTFPRSRPAFERILVDGARRLWVKDFEPVPDSPGTWTVFDQAGAMLGTVSTPPKFRVFEVGSDYVLGRWRDVEGVAYIHLFELRERRE
jgi:hypothetical protein